MKKFLLFPLALAAVIACNKQTPDPDPEPEPEPKPEPTPEYVVYGGEIITKTVIGNSFSLQWADTDDLAVYTWPTTEALPETADEWRACNPAYFTTTDDKSSPRPFVLAEKEPVNTLGETPYHARLEAFKNRYAASESLDYGVIYPGRMANASRPGLGIVVFGDDKQVLCVQNGNDNTDHLPAQDVLWGFARGKDPVVDMQRLGTLMVYTVENTSDKDFTVSSVKIAVPSANIAGSFRVNVFDGTFDSCMTALHEITLTVENGAVIPVGGSAKFYQVLAPFSLNANQQITMTVVTDQGVWSETTTLTEGKSFKSGKTNEETLKVVFEVPDVDPELVQHNTDEIWFSSDSNLSGYFDLENAVMSKWGGNFDQADIDVVVFRGSSKTALTFAAPTDEPLQEWIDNSIKTWETKNATTFKKVEADFDAIKKMSELEALYIAATGEDCRCILSTNETLIAKTVNGNYAMIKVTGGQKYGDAWGSYTLSLKTVE